MDGMLLIFEKKILWRLTREKRIWHVRCNWELWHILLYAQQPLKNFDRPLVNISLSNSILVNLFSTRGRVMGDKSIASWANQIGTKVLLERDYDDYNLLRSLNFHGLRFFNEPVIPRPPRPTRTRTTTSTSTSNEDILDWRLDQGRAWETATLPLVQSTIIVYTLLY